MGRMLEAQEIYDGLKIFLQPGLLTGRHVLITAGPSFEAIDAVRGITNRSSGKMGYAIARAALDAGATVTLVSGPTSMAAPVAARVEHVESANEMFDAVKKHVKAADICIGVAAVADYRAEKTSAQKIKKTDRSLNLKLIPNPDIIAWVAALPKPPFCVGFAAESQNLRRFAEEKRKHKKLPLLAANLAQNAIGADDNELVLFDDNGIHSLPRAPKTVVARQLIAHIAELYEGTRKKKA